MMPKPTAVGSGQNINAAGLIASSMPTTEHVMAKAATNAGPAMKPRSGQSSDLGSMRELTPRMWRSTHALNVPGACCLRAEPPPICRSRTTQEDRSQSACRYRRSSGIENNWPIWAASRSVGANDPVTSRRIWPRV